ncbi:ROK family protein [Actinoallomurus sp. NBC_01490]|uniref:ROK family protein n=1 Tax=Actinoallomurus sp. NBC_01490 TaxID=2903557 RepID=UPI002E355A68|nr:ROK family protein [Actinoallomurus sp. NBC_01490]
MGRARRRRYLHRRRGTPWQGGRCRRDRIPHRPQQRCRRRGTRRRRTRAVRAEVGARAIIRLAHELAARPGHTSSLAGRPTLDVPTVFAAAAADDPVGRKVVDTVAARLAAGLAPLLLVLDPDMLVIGGGISRAGARIIDSVAAHLRRLLPNPETARDGAD